jgi:hypothetical protein
MKKKQFYHFHHVKENKFPLNLKSIFILLLTIIMNISATVFGQISFVARDKPIREVLAIIEKQTRYRFFYNDDLIPVKKTVNMEVKNQSIENVLNKLFKRTEYSYTLMANNLVVISLKNNSRQTPDSSKVINKKTGNQFVRITLLLKATRRGSSSEAWESCL